jgi:DNA-binding YbaB/EbfC family protein
MKARLPEGYGKQSQKQMLDRLNRMQADMEAKQNELHEKQYSAKAGGGMVEAVVSGERRVLSVTIDPEVCDPEDTEMLGDLVAAAVNAALEAANADYESEMGKITGGMDLGGLM